MIKFAFLETRPTTHCKATTPPRFQHSSCAGITVLTRPRDLTRKQLKELVLALDQAGFTEMRLATAWRELSNQDIAARIIGHIRQAPTCCFYA